MKTLCIIPARGESSRLKRKNVRLLKNLPLIIYTLKSAKESQCLFRIVVSTDDQEIATIAQGEGIPVVMRPAEYAQHTSPIYFALRHAVKEIEKSEKWKPDIVVWLQPNVPFREKGLIDQVVKRLIDEFEKADSVVTVYLVKSNPKAMKVINNGFLEYREKPEQAYFLTQDLQKCYMLDGSVMAIKTKILMDETIPMTNGHFYMGKMMPYVHDFPYTVEVDDEKDFFLLEYILDKKLVIL